VARTSYLVPDTRKRQEAARIPTQAVRRAGSGPGGRGGAASPRGV